MRTSYLIILASFLFCLPFRTTAQIQASSEKSPSKIKSTTENTSSSTPSLYTFQTLDHEPIPLNYKEVCKKIQQAKSVNRIQEEILVQIRVLVNEEGNVETYKSVNTNDPEMVKILRPYIEELTFKPATRNGTPVASWLSVPFRFKFR